MTRGARFGDAFDPRDVERVPWGRVEFTFADCNRVEVRYASDIPGYGSGTRIASRLTALGGTACIDGTPAPPAHFVWTERARMPDRPQSELDVAALDGWIYALGGFGDTRGFKRYDPASNAWSALTQLPAGRDHLAAFALDGGVFYVGGAQNGGGEQGVGGFRYDVEADAWEPRPELPFVFGSHAAVLDGRVYVGDDDGSLREYDPVQRLVRRIAPPDATPRDHAQVVAFLGEIWVIAGRGPGAENATVAIYDPVSGRWRQGPRVRRVRGGFAAAVLGDRIVIGGGEVLNDGIHLEVSTETYTAGTDAWQLGTNLPVPVHGAAAAVVDNRAYFVSGSIEAGSPCCATGRVFSLQLDP